MIQRFLRPSLDHLFYIGDKNMGYIILKEYGTPKVRVLFIIATMCFLLTVSSVSRGQCPDDASGLPGPSVEDDPWTTGYTIQYMSGGCELGIYFCTRPIDGGQQVYIYQVWDFNNSGCTGVTYSDMVNAAKTLVLNSPDVNLDLHCGEEPYQVNVTVYTAQCWTFESIKSNSVLQPCGLEKAWCSETCKVCVDYTDPKNPVVNTWDCTFDGAYSDQICKSSTTWETGLCYTVGCPE